MEAPGAKVTGAEAEAIWLVNDYLTLGGNFSYTPSEYTKSLWISDPSRVSVPESLYPDFDALVEDIKGNQLVQVPETKGTAWASYLVPLQGGAQIELLGIYSWIDEVYYSPFEQKAEMADGYSRTDFRATWTSSQGNWGVTAFVNNIFDDVGVLQVLRQSEAEYFRHNAGITLPRLYGIELSYNLN